MKQKLSNLKLLKFSNALGFFFSSPIKDPLINFIAKSIPDSLSMPSSTFSGLISSPKVDVVIDMGNPLLNKSLDGFLKIGTVAASSVVVEETYHCLKKGSVSKSKVEDALKKMCMDGAYWGSVAGVYVGMEYGVERIRGTKDWKNAMLGGAITGALISAASNKNGDQIVVDAIRGGAVATAAEFLNYLT